MIKNIVSEQRKGKVCMVIKNNVNALTRNDNWGQYNNWKENRKFRDTVNRTAGKKEKRKKSKIRSTERLERKFRDSVDRIAGKKIQRQRGEQCDMGEHFFILARKRLDFQS